MITPFSEAMGLRTKDRRNELRLSLDDLAERTELSKTGLWQIEKGRSIPGAGTLWRLSRALRMSIDAIVIGNEQP